MSSENNQSNILSSWKEISAYLRCGVRTCMRYEGKYGLPIRRLEEKPKTYVFAYKDELDEWLQNKRNKNVDATKRFKWYKSLYFSIPIFAIALFFIYLFFRESVNLQPYAFKIEKSSLIVLNEKGKSLWQHDTGIENLQSDAQYQKHHQFKKVPEKNDASMILPWIVIKDLNKDQKAETLFSLQTQDQYNGGKLICLNHKGRPLWEFSGGREISFGTEVFADFTIRGIDIADIDYDGLLEIIVISNAVLRYPTRISILNNEGRILGEYWNSGHIGDYCFTDLDKDGRQELIVVGLNNEYRKGCLIVLNPLNLKGYSPQQQDDYRCNASVVGSELYYILFPRTDIDYLIYEVEAVKSIKKLENNFLSVTMNLSSLIYKLDYKLKVQNVIMSHKFKNLHRELLREGKISSELSDYYARNLANGFLYWNGQNWVSYPAMNSFWKNKALNN